MIKIGSYVDDLKRENQYLLDLEFSEYLVYIWWYDILYYSAYAIYSEIIF